MLTLLQLINAGASGLICLALLGAILSPRVHDGVIMKVGLICMALGFGAMALRLWVGIKAADVQSLERALLLINAGIAVFILGYLLRKTRHPNAPPITDWGALPPPPEVRK